MELLKNYFHKMSFNTEEEDTLHDNAKFLAEMGEGHYLGLVRKAVTINSLNIRSSYLVVNFFKSKKKNIVSLEI